MFAAFEGLTRYTTRAPGTKFLFLRMRSPLHHCCPVMMMGATLDGCLVHDRGHVHSSTLLALRPDRKPSVCRPQQRQHLRGVPQDCEVLLPRPDLQRPQRGRRPIPAQYVEATSEARCHDQTGASDAPLQFVRRIAISHPHGRRIAPYVGSRTRGARRRHGSRTLHNTASRRVSAR